MSSPLTRRSFLATASAFAATALVGCGGGGGGSAGGLGASDLPLALETDPNRRLLRCERRHFEGLVGATFRMSEIGPDAPDAVNATLIRVVDESISNPDAEALGFREPFRLGLRGPDGRLGQDGIYRLSHPETGDLDLSVNFGGTVDDVDSAGDPVLRHAFLVYFT